MSMPSFHTIPKEVGCAALLSDVYTCMGVSDRVFVISQCACRAIYFKNLAFNCLVTSSGIETFFQRSLRKGVLLYMVLVPIKEVASSPWLGLLGVPLNSVLSFFLFFFLVFPFHSVIHQQETIAKTKPRCLTMWPFHCLIFWSGSILWWENGKSLKAGAIHIHNLPSRTSIFKTSVKFHIGHIMKLWWNDLRHTLFSLFVFFLFLVAGENRKRWG